MYLRLMATVVGAVVATSAGSLFAQPYPPYQPPPQQRQPYAPQQRVQPNQRQVVVDAQAMNRELASANDRVRNLEIALQRVCDRRCGPEIMEMVSGIRHDLREIGQELDRSLGAGGPRPPVYAPAYTGGARRLPIIADQELAQLMGQLSGRWQIEEKLQVLQQYAEQRLFAVVHIRQIAEQFYDSNSRLRAIAILAPRTIDPQRSARLEDLFWDAQGQRAVRDLFRGRRGPEM